MAPCSQLPLVGWKGLQVDGDEDCMQVEEVKEEDQDLRWKIVSALSSWSHRTASSSSSASSMVFAAVISLVKIFLDEDLFLR